MPTNGSGGGVEWLREVAAENPEGSIKFQKGDRRDYELIVFSRAFFCEKK